MAEYSVVGKRLPDVDGPKKVTGQAQYVNDLVLPAMLFGKVLHSPYPHALIRNIDTSKAERLPGVKAVITGKDTAGITYGSVPRGHDEYPLAIGKVRYIGDSVAAVAAIDEDTAEDALELIDVEYEELPAVFDPEEAMKDSAPQIHDLQTSPFMYDEKHNISLHQLEGYGDMDRGFAEADHIREDRFVTEPQAHAALEPHSALSHFDSTSGTLTHWADSQMPFFLRYNLAKTLKIPESKVRVIKPFVGGGFGGKVPMFAKDDAAAILSKLTGRPVKIIYTREEVFLSTISTYGKVIYIRTGMKKDGTITAQHIKLIYDNGAYNETAGLISRSARSDSIYRTPCWSYEGFVVYTNKTPSGPRRGHTSPEKTNAIVTQLHMMAADLGLDPIEVNRKNFIHPGYVRMAGAEVKGTAQDSSEIGTAALTECFDAVVKKSGWSEKRGKMGPYRGIGIGAATFGGPATGSLSAQFYNPSGAGNMTHNPIMAIIKINADGRVSLLTGATDIGQGANSTMAQIAAEELGLSQDDVTFVHPIDTAVNPFEHGTFGSRVTFNQGHVVREAAADAKRQLLKAIAESTEVGEDEIMIKEGMVYLKGNPEPAMPFGNALRMIQRADKLPIAGTYRYYPPEYFAGLPTESSPACYVQAAEVEVDPETGKVKVLRITYAEDCGTKINPMRVEGQMDGCIQMGAGSTVNEHFVYDEGQTLNASFLHYGFLTSVDMPEVVSIPVEGIDPRGPFGAKEAGEGGTCSMPPAIIDAIYDATGVWLKELSVTPENVLRALEEKASKEKKQG